MLCQGLGATRAQVFLVDIRVVHAWWHQPHVDLIASRLLDGQPMSIEFLMAAFDRGSPEWVAMDGLCGAGVRLFALGAPPQSQSH